MAERFEEMHHIVPTDAVEQKVSPDDAGEHETAGKPEDAGKSETIGKPEDAGGGEALESKRPSPEEQQKQELQEGQAKKLGAHNRPSEGDDGDDLEIVRRQIAELQTTPMEVLQQRAERWRKQEAERRARKEAAARNQRGAPSQPKGPTLRGGDWGPKLTPEGRKRLEERLAREREARARWIAANPRPQLSPEERAARRIERERKRAARSERDRLRAKEFGAGTKKGKEGKKGKKK